MHIKKDDIVMVLSGRKPDKGKKGKVLRVIPEKDKIVVQNVNLVKKHSRASKQSKGGIVSQEAPIHASKVMVYCSNCKGPVRVKVKLLDNNDKLRICSKCNEELDKK